jgi:hypothetical protein
MKTFNEDGVDIFMLSRSKNDRNSIGIIKKPKGFSTAESYMVNKNSLKRIIDLCLIQSGAIDAIYRYICLKEKLKYYQINPSLVCQRKCGSIRKKYKGKLI